jgi:hypothetical protein
VTACASRAALTRKSTSLPAQPRRSVLGGWAVVQREAHGHALGETVAAALRFLDGVTARAGQRGCCSCSRAPCCAAPAHHRAAGHHVHNSYGQGIGCSAVTRFIRQIVKLSLSAFRSSRRRECTAGFVVSSSFHRSAASVSSQPKPGVLRCLALWPASPVRLSKQCDDRLLCESLPQHVPPLLQRCLAAWNTAE